MMFILIVSGAIGIPAGGIANRVWSTTLAMEVSGGFDVQNIMVQETTGWTTRETYYNVFDCRCVK